MLSSRQTQSANISVTFITPSNPHPQPSTHKPLDPQPPDPQPLDPQPTRPTTYFLSHQMVTKYLARSPVTARKWKRSVRQASNQIFILQVGLIGPIYPEVPEVPMFKSSHVLRTSSHHAYETHCRQLNQLYNYCQQNC